MSLLKFCPCDRYYAKRAVPRACRSVAHTGGPPPATLAGCPRTCAGASDEYSVLDFRRNVIRAVAMILEPNVVGRRLIDQSIIFREYFRFSPREPFGFLRGGCRVCGFRPPASCCSCLFQFYIIQFTLRRSFIVWCLKFLMKLSKTLKSKNDNSLVFSDFVHEKCCFNQLVRGVS